jgi:predicted ATPase
MKIDLHCHTKKTKKGDAPTRNVSPERFAEAIEANGVGIVAITNHNAFDKDQFLELSRAVGENAQLWPGVELDVHGDREGSRWHMLMIASPKQVECFDAAVQALIGDTSPNDVFLHISDVFACLEMIDAIFISHAHDKNPHLTQADMLEMNSLINEQWRLFYEPRKLATVGIWSNHGFNMMLGSDVQDWDNYPGCELPSLRLPVNSFEQFCLLAKRDGTTIQTLLGGTESFSVVGHPHDGVNVPLTLRNEINVFFGQKGTGKTELLKSIERHLIAQGKVCCSYYGNDKHGDFKALLSTSDVKREPADFGRSDGTHDLAFVCNWKDASITPLESYVAWFKTRNNNTNKRRFALSEAQSIPEEGDGRFLRDCDARTVLQAFRKQANLELFARYMSDEDSVALSTLLDKLETGIAVEREEHFVRYRSAELANSALEYIKQLIDAKSDTKSKPSSTGFVKFAQNRIRLYEAAKRLLDSIQPGEIIDRDYLGDLDDKGKAYIVTRLRYLCEDSKTDEYNGGIQKLKGLRHLIQDVRDHAFDSEAGVACADFAHESKSMDVSDLSAFIGVKRYVALNGTSEPYVPSSGEEGILLLGHRLNDTSADVYILDEPELGMSNSYIDAIVRGRIQQIASMKKTVIIATHNANLAVRTLPYVSVYREHVNGDHYRTYFGNPFSDKLIDIEGLADSLSWSAKSLEVLEGSGEAFYNRKDIYEAGVR